MLNGFSNTQGQRAPHGVPAAPAHPLERRTATSHALLRQLVLSCSLLVAALVAGAFVGHVAMPLIIGAAAGSCIFALLFAVATETVRDALVDAVARGELRVAGSLAPRRLSKLLSTGNRRTLAGTLGLCLRPAWRRHDIFAAARAHVRRDPDLRRQLEAVIARLQCDDGGAVGVALVHQLITDPDSPLHCGTADELRESLGRIGYRLVTDLPRGGDH
jgi:hypothetical protein